MQLVLGRKRSANHPVCLFFSFSLFSSFFRDWSRCLFARGKGALPVKIKGRKPRIRRGVTGASTRSSYICTRLEPDSGEKPSSSSSPSSSSPIPGRDPVGKSLRKNEYAALHGRILFYKIYYLVPAHYPPSSANSPQVFRAKSQTQPRDKIFLKVSKNFLFENRYFYPGKGGFFPLLN